MTRLLTRVLAPLVLVLALAGCASFVGETPAQRLYGVQADFSAALKLAVAYTARPACAPGQTILCAEPAVSAKIRTLAGAADSALKTARQFAGAPGWQSYVGVAGVAVGELLRYLATTRPRAATAAGATVNWRTLS